MSASYENVPPNAATPTNDHVGDIGTQTPHSIHQPGSIFNQGFSGPTQSAQGQEQLNPYLARRDLLRVIRKRWLMIIVILTASVSMAVSVVVGRAPIYKSTAILLIKLGREFIYRPDVGQSAMLLNRNPEALIHAEVEILRSSALSDAVVTHVGKRSLYPDLATSAPETRALHDTAVRRFNTHFSATAVPNSNVIRVSFQHPEPEMSARALNVAVDLFKEKHLDAFSNPQMITFLKGKVEAYRQRFEALEEKISRVQADNRSMIPTVGKHWLYQQYEERYAEMVDALHQSIGLKKKITYLMNKKKELFQDVTLFAKPATVTDIRVRLTELRINEQNLLTKYKASHEKITEVQRQIKLLESLLQEHSALLDRSKFLQVLEADIIKANAEWKFQQSRAMDLEEQVDQLSRQLKVLPQFLHYYRGLIRERNAHQENYQTYLKRLEAAQVSEEMNRLKIASISVIQAGSVPLRPVGHHIWLTIVGGLILGGMVALGSAFAIESIKHKKTDVV